MKALIGTNADGVKFWVNPKRINEYSNCRIEYRDVTDQEIVELRIPEAMVTVKIPIQVFMSSTELQEKIKVLDLLYNWLDRRTIDGYLYIENIDTHDVPEYLSQEEYIRMKSAGVIFPQEIINIYENAEEEIVEDNDEEIIENEAEETATEEEIVDEE